LKWQKGVKIKMKKMLMLVTLGALLMLALAASPVFAASKTEKVAYTASGYIDGPTNWGAMSLTISGNIHQRTPDYTSQGYASYSIPFYIDYTEVSVSEYEDQDGNLWMAKTGIYLEEVRHASGVLQIEGWYSPQSKFNGKIDADWQDSSTMPFTVQLDPNKIQKETIVGTMTISFAETTMTEYYIWEEFDEYGWWMWQYAETGDSVTLSSVTYDLVETTLYFDLSGKTQSKGAPPIQGTVMLWDTFRIIDGVSEERSIYGNGMFGSYHLSF
jgi:hypothetical protein